MEGLRGSRVVAEARQGECVLDEPEFDHDTRSVSNPFALFIGRIRFHSVQGPNPAPSASRGCGYSINGLRRQPIGPKFFVPGLERTTPPPSYRPGDEGVSS
jgi:hypothetical protein